MSSERGEGREKLEGLAFRLVRLPLRCVPRWIEAIGAGAFISGVVERNPRFRARLKELQGKVFLFEATDIAKNFHLRITGDDIMVVPNIVGEPDVTMRGEVRVLVDLLLGREDADTVFFSRKLEISGDTAVAIHFKNILADL
ncbi:MAG: SCP2 sterol-binding domain-containing protein [Thermodesulfobacteriota bacterium]